MKFLDLHFRYQRTSQPIDDATSDAFHRARDHKGDWSRSRQPKRYTYLSMFGGTYHFGNDPAREAAAREAIADDVTARREDYRGRPLALAECAHVPEEGPVTFPFFLDADIKSPVPRTHAEVVAFARDIVVPTVASFFPEATAQSVRVLVCAADEPKDLTTRACKTCGAVVRAGSTCCGSVEDRPLFKTAVHYRIWNCPGCVVVAADAAVAIMSAIYSEALAHPVYRTWGDADAWREWCDVAPVRSAVPSLRVLGTVKSSRCHGCEARKDVMHRCIVCGGSGKVIADRPYRVVGCVAHGGADVQLPTGAEALHATSIRTRAAPTDGFRGPRPGIPTLQADKKAVDQAHGLLRNETLDTFQKLSDAEQRRLRLKTGATVPWRPRGTYRPETDPRIVAAVHEALAACPGFAGHYVDTTVTGVFQQPKAPYRIVAKVDGFNSTFCFNRGADAAGRPRPPGPHNSSRVYFVLDADRGVRQRCFSEKTGASGTCCRSWEGTAWQPLDDDLRDRIWWHKRKETTGAVVGLPARPTQEARATAESLAGNVHRLLFQGIDHGRAQAALTAIDPRHMLACCRELAAEEAGVALGNGFVPRNLADDIMRLLDLHNLDEPRQP